MNKASEAERVSYKQKDSGPPVRNADARYYVFPNERWMEDKRRTRSGYKKKYRAMLAHNHRTTNGMKWNGATGRRKGVGGVEGDK